MTILAMIKGGEWGSLTDFHRHLLRFDEGEPRDPNGEWTDGGGGGKDKSSEKDSADKKSSQEKKGDQEAKPLTQSSEKSTASALKKVGQKALGGNELTDDEQTSVAKYVHIDFRKINNSLRREESPKITERIKNLDAAIGKSKLTDPIIVYRGAGSKLADSAEAGIGGGKSFEFTDKAFISTSANKKTAVSFSEDFFEIKIPKGTSALAIPSIAYPGSGIGTNISESELLLGRSHRFKVIGVSKDPEGHRHFTAELAS
jgi:hypothetical protein